MSKEKFLGVDCIHIVNHQDQILYVCKATGKVDDEYICATSDGRSLSEAEGKAKDKLTNLILDIRDGKQIISKDPFVNSSTSSVKIENKNHLNGGGSKKISAGQINLINKLAAEHDTDSDTVARKMYDKPIDELLGSEANVIIKSMIKRG